MYQQEDLYERVTRLRVQAFDLIDELSRAEEADGTRTLALVQMQAVANGLGRLQCSLPLDGAEAAL